MNEFISELVKEAKDVIARDLTTDGEVSAEKRLTRAFQRAVSYGRFDAKRRREQYAWEKLFVVVFAAVFVSCALFWALLHL